MTQGPAEKKDTPVTLQKYVISVHFSDNMLEKT